MEVFFDLSLLGPPVIRDRTGRELTWRLHRALQIVAYLAIRPEKRASRSELVEALWHDSPRTTIRNNFNPTLSDARRSLTVTNTVPMKSAAEVIPLLHGTYALSPTIRWQTDLERFRELIDQGRAARSPEGALQCWQEAWRLYRGPFLDGLEAPWIHAQREALTEEYFDVLVRLGALAADLDEEVQALDAYRSALLVEPYDERVHRALMALYARRGRRDLVRRQFLRLEESLEELGVEPAAETRESFQRWMR